jgi:hypothetical protein
LEYPVTRLAIAVLALMVLEPATAIGQDLDRRIPVEPGGMLQVDLDFGEEIRSERVSLEVRSHDADEVWAVADLSGLGASSIQFRIESDDHVVRLYGRSGGLMSWIFGGPGVAVRVWVPREFSIDLRCTSGPVRIEEVRGNIRARTREASIDVRGAEGSQILRTTSGTIRVTESVGDVAVKAAQGAIELSWINGNVDAQTGEGDIVARHLDGRNSLRTDDGEISVRNVRGPVEAKTERGAVYASFAGPPEGVIETYSGSVEVVLPDHSGTALDARARRGSVAVGPGLEVQGDRGEDHFVGAVNGGGEPLRVYTARGSIRVERR